MLIPVSNVPRDYSWGSTDLIPRLEGRAPTGAPEAEIWYGDHPGNPSRVTGTDSTLDEALAAAGEPTLPFLLKLLAAGSSLSIQAHPTKAQAAAGFAREEAAGIPRDAADRLYRDDNHKPEIIVALSEEFRALVGIREVDATRALLQHLGGGTALAHLAALLGDDDEERAVRSALEWALTQASADDVAELTAALDAAPGTAADPFAAEIHGLRVAANDFPGDRGLFVAVLMNLIVLRRGQALFAPAGVLHAYQSGLGVELMAASDNVLRGGLTPKHVDVPELLRVLDPTTGAAPLVAPHELAPGVEEFAPPVPDFALVRAELSGTPVTITRRGPAIVLATSGAVTVAQGDQQVSLRPGAGVYVGGSEDTVILSGSGEAFVAQPGRA